MDQATAHHIEMLEAANRQYRQSLRILAEAVLAGHPDTQELARLAKVEILGEPA
ncbi:MAG: hypothetical protein AB7L09_02090 [Nitrospira sp.]